MLGAILAGLAYTGANAAAYVAIGANEKKAEKGGKGGKVLPSILWALGLIFFPALLLRKAFPLTGTPSWRKQFKKKVEDGKKKFETKDTKTKGKDKEVKISDKTRTEAEKALASGDYKKAFKLLNKSLNDGQAEIMADQFAKYVLRYRVDPASITVDKIIELVNTTNKIQFKSKSTSLPTPPELGGNDLFARANAELDIANENRELILSIRTRISESKAKRAVKNELTKLIDRAQKLCVENFSFHFSSIDAKVTELLGKGKDLELADLKALEEIIEAQEKFKSKYQEGMYKTMDVSAEKIMAKAETARDDKERLLVDLNRRFGVGAAVEYYEDYQHSITIDDRKLAEQSMQTYNKIHSPKMEKYLGTVSKLVLFKQFREATVGKTDEEKQRIMAEMGITKEMLDDKDNAIFMSEEVYNNVNADELSVFIELEYHTLAGNAEKVTELTRRKEEILAAKFKEIEDLLEADFDSKEAMKALFKAYKDDYITNENAILLLLRVQNLKIAITKAITEERERPVDLSKEKEAAKGRIKEEAEKILAGKDPAFISNVEKNLSMFYDQIDNAASVSLIKEIEGRAMGYLSGLDFDLDAYKEEVIKKLNSVVDLSTVTDPEKQTAIKELLDLGAEAIKAGSTREEVDDAFETYKKQINDVLTRAREEGPTEEERLQAYKELENYYTSIHETLSEKGRMDAANLLGEAKEGVMNPEIKTKDQLAAFIAGYKEKIDALEKKVDVDLSSEKAAAIEKIDQEYMKVAGLVGSGDLTIEGYKDAIRNATTIDEINKNRDLALNYIRSLLMNLTDLKASLIKDLEDKYGSLTLEGQKAVELKQLLEEARININGATSHDAARIAYNSYKGQLERLITREEDRGVSDAEKEAAYQRVVKHYESIKNQMSKEGQERAALILESAKVALTGGLVFTKDELAKIEEQFIEKLNGLKKDNSKELEDAKNKAKAELATEFEKFVDSFPEKAGDGTKIYSTYLDNITRAGSIEEVQNFLANAKNDFAKLAVAKDPIEEYKKAAIGRINDFKEKNAETIKANMTPEAEGQLSGIIEELKKATTKQKVDEAESKAMALLRKLNVHTIEQYKEKLKEELKEYAKVEGLDAEAQKEIEGLVATGCEEIDAADTKQLARGAFVRAKNAIDKIKAKTKDPNDLETAKAKGKEEIEAARLAAEKEVSEKDLMKLNGIVEAYNQSIDSAVTVDEVKKYVAEAKEQIAALPRKTVDIADAKKAGKEEIEAARLAAAKEVSEKDLIKLNGIVEAYNQSIDSAVTVDEVKKYVAEAKEQIAALPRKTNDLEEAKKAAKEEVESARSALVGEIPEAEAEAKSVADKYNNLIDNAKTVDEVKKLVGDAKAALLEVKKGKRPEELDLEAAKREAKETIEEARKAAVSENPKAEAEAKSIADKYNDLIDAETDINKISEHVRNAKNALAEIKKDESLDQDLEDAKKKAKSEIEETKNTVLKDNEEAKTDADTIVEEYKKKIDAAKTIDEVESLKKEANDKLMKLSKTKDPNEEELKKKKADAKSELQGEVDKLQKDFPEADVAGIVSTANDAIDNAKTVSDVNTALETAKRGLSELRKKLEGEKELNTAKANAKDRVSKEADSLKKDFADVDVESIISEANNAIDNATTTDAVRTAEEKAMEKIAAIRKEKEAQKELENNKKEAKDEVAREAENLKKEFPEADVAGIISDANTAIDKATTKDEVRTAVTNAKSRLAELKKTLEAKKELENAKATAREDVEKAVASLKKDFADADTSGIEGAARTAIDNATTIDQVKEAVKKANEDLAELKQKLQAEKELADAKSKAKGDVESAVASLKKDFADADTSSIASTANEAIEKATTVDQVREAVSNAEKQLGELRKQLEEAKKLEEAKGNAVEEVEKTAKRLLEEYPDSATDTNGVKETALEAIKNAKTQDELKAAVINAKEGFDRIVANEKKKAEELANAKKTAKESLSNKCSELTGAYPEGKKDAKDIADDFAKKIDDAKNKDEVTQILSQAETKLGELKAKLEQAKRELESYKQTAKGKVDQIHDDAEKELTKNYKGQSTKKANEIKSKIDNAKSKDEIDKLVENYRDAVKTIITKSKTCVSITLQMELNGKMVPVSVNNKSDGSTIVSIPHIEKLKIKPGYQNLSDISTQNEILRQARAHAEKAREAANVVVEGQQKK